jgi:hypothetical protein
MLLVVKAKQLFHIAPRSGQTALLAWPFQLHAPRPRIQTTLSTRLSWRLFAGQDGGLRVTRQRAGLP